MKRQFTTAILTAVALLFAIPPVKAQIEQQRLQFAKGKSSITVKGAIKNAESKYYVLRAKAGQTLSASLNSPNSGIMIVGVRQNGGEWEDGNLSGEWSGKVPATGDYVIEIGIADGEPNGNFTLTVSLK